MSQIQPAWLPDEKQTEASHGLVGWSLRREIDFIVRSRRLIGACVGVCVLAVGVYNYGTRPLYEAVAVVSLDQAGSSPLTAMGPMDEMRRTAALQYEVRLLRSAELARLAVTDIDGELANDLAKGPLGGWRERMVEEAKIRLGFPTRFGSSLPDFADAFRSRLSVDHEPPSTWVYIRFRGYDPIAPVVALKRLVSFYLAETEKRTKGYAGANQEDLERRVAERRGEAVETLGKLKTFEQQLGVGDIEARREALTKEAARLQDSLITVRQTGLTRKALVDESATLPVNELLAIPSMRDDPVVAEATRQIADLESRIARQATTLGDRHPEIAGLVAERDVARQRRDGRLEALREALDRDYRLTSREEADISAMLETTKRRLAALDKNSLERSFIQTEAAASQRAVTDLITRSVRQSDSQVFFAPTVLQEPSPSQTPVSPQRRRNFEYALGIGLLAGVLLAWLRAHLDETLKTPEDVKARFALPLLGMVPLVYRSRFDLLAPDENRAARLFEAYRVLRTNLMLNRDVPKAHPITLLTSSRAGEGKTTTTCGLGIVMAQAGLRVLLVDGDLRRANLSRLFKAQTGPGLSDAIDGRPIRECIAPTDVPGLSLLAAGSFRPNPAELLNREALVSAFQSIRPDYDWILCDAPPVLAVADAAILARVADSALLVIGANLTPVTSVRASLEQLVTVGAIARGLVLNRVDLSRDSHYFRYYYGDKYDDYANRSRQGGADPSRPEGAA